MFIFHVLLTLELKITPSLEAVTHTHTVINALAHYFQEFQKASSHSQIGTSRKHTASQKSHICYV